MSELSLKHLETLKIDTGDRVEYGCNQEQYREFWRRMAGCGPSVVATMYGYHMWKGQVKPLEEWLSLMDDVWEDVTPTMKGLPSVVHLTERIERYLFRTAPHFEYTALDVPGIGEDRPALQRFIEFISDSLERDEPVAFLVLDTGEAENLDDWHWTVIVSLEARDNSAIATIYNSGVKCKVNIGQWYETTRKGGGLVALRPR